MLFMQQPRTQFTMYTTMAIRAFLYEAENSKLGTQTTCRGELENVSECKQTPSNTNNTQLCAVYWISACVWETGDSGREPATSWVIGIFLCLSSPAWWCRPGANCCCSMAGEICTLGTGVQGRRGTACCSLGSHHISPAMGISNNSTASCVLPLYQHYLLHFLCICALLMEQIKIMQNSYAGIELLLERSSISLFCIELSLLVFFLPDRWGSQKRIMNLDSFLIKTCNISKLFSIPIFTFI